MYMFFWFFKQLYYCLRRIFKSGILLLIVFFIAFLFIFVKPTFAYSNATFLKEFDGTIQNAYSKLPEYNDEYYYFAFQRTNGNIDIYFFPKTNFTSISLVATPYYNNNWGRIQFYYNSPSFSAISYTYDSNSNTFITRTNPNFSNGVAFMMKLYDGSTDQRYSYINTNFFVYNYNDNSQVVFYPDNYNPLILNQYEIPSWDFSNLIVSGGYMLQSTNTIVSRTTYTLYSYIGDYTSTLNVKPYINYIYPMYLKFNIPRQQLLNNYNLQGNETIHFVLNTVYTYNGNSIIDNWDLGTYTLGISSDDVYIINSNSDKQLISNINDNLEETLNTLTENTNAINNLNNSQQETTEAIENLENTITNPNIDDNSINLPTDNTNDITQNGLNTIFTSIYNAFCVGQPQDIIFPIPFTNRNITLQPNYVRNMLTNNGATWVITIIEAFWWYLISRFIIKDITNKITKIKSGNIEDIENTNIKGDML